MALAIPIKSNLEQQIEIVEANVGNDPSHSEGLPIFSFLKENPDLNSSSLFVPIQDTSSLVSKYKTVVTQNNNTHTTKKTSFGNHQQQYSTDSTSLETKQTPSLYSINKSSTYVDQSTKSSYNRSSSFSSISKPLVSTTPSIPDLSEIEEIQSEKFSTPSFKSSTTTSPSAQKKRLPSPIETLDDPEISFSTKKFKKDDSPTTDLHHHTFTSKSHPQYSTHISSPIKLFDISYDDDKLFKPKNNSNNENKLDDQNGFVSFSNTASSTIITSSTTSTLVEWETTLLQLEEISKSAQLAKLKAELKLESLSSEQEVLSYWEEYKKILQNASSAASALFEHQKNKPTLEQPQQIDTHSSYPISSTNVNSENTINNSNYSNFSSNISSNTDSTLFKPLEVHSVQKSYSSSLNLVSDDEYDQDISDILPSSPHQTPIEIISSPISKPNQTYTDISTTPSSYSFVPKSPTEQLKFNNSSSSSIIQIGTDDDDDFDYSLLDLNSPSKNNNTNRNNNQNNQNVDDINNNQNEIHSKVISTSAAPLQVTHFESIPPQYGQTIEQYDAYGAWKSSWRTNRFPWASQLDDVVIKFFGHHKWRPNQLEIINAIMSGCNVFVTMPTGGGKSLCYQVPAMCLPGVTIVIQPLISLIEDQISILTSLDIPCAFLASTQYAGNASTITSSAALSQIKSRSPNLKILFISPEKLVYEANPWIDRLGELLQQHENNYGGSSGPNSQPLVSLFVIDECHCVSQWGHEFRSAYVKLSLLKHKCPQVPILALTATATIPVKLDILTVLQMLKPTNAFRSNVNMNNNNLQQNKLVCFTSSFDRPNLFYQVIKKTDKTLDIIHDWIAAHPGESGIVYCFSKKDTSNIASMFTMAGLSCTHYHADLSTEERSIIQTQWMAGKYQFICATIAFGMGINKPNVRWVIHYSVPSSLEGLYQEAGRAGRDGKEALCLVFYRISDLISVEKLKTKNKNEGGQQIQQSAGNKLVIKENLATIKTYLENRSTCRRVMLMQHFGETLIGINPETFNCHSCDNCLNPNPIVRLDCTQLAFSIMDVVKSSGKVVLSKITKELTKKTNINLFPSNMPSIKTERESLLKRIVTQLAGENYLKSEARVTSYGSYLEYTVKKPLEKTKTVVLTTREDASLDLFAGAKFHTAGHTMSTIRKQLSEGKRRNSTSSISDSPFSASRKLQQKSPTPTSTFNRNSAIDSLLNEPQQYVPDNEIDDYDEYTTNDDYLMDYYYPNEDETTTEITESKSVTSTWKNTKRPTMPGTSSSSSTSISKPTSSTTALNPKSSSTSQSSIVSLLPESSPTTTLPKANKKTSAKKASSSKSPFDDPFDTLRSKLLEQLVELRAKIHNEESRAATVQGTVDTLFPHTLLVRMSKKLPVQAAQVAAIEGIGVKRSEKYGARFACLISDFLVEHPALTPFDDEEDLTIISSMAAATSSVPPPTPSNNINNNGSKHQSYVSIIDDDYDMDEFFTDSYQPNSTSTYSLASSGSSYRTKPQNDIPSVFKIGHSSLSPPPTTSPTSSSSSFSRHKVLSQFEHKR